MQKGIKVAKGFLNSLSKVDNGNHIVMFGQGFANPCWYSLRCPF